MAQVLQSCLGNLAKTGYSNYAVRKLNPNQIQCVITEDNRRSVVKNGNDSLEICKVVNGMWQTSGGWGRIDRSRFSQYLPTTRES